MTNVVDFPGADEDEVGVRFPSSITSDLIAHQIMVQMAGAVDLCEAEWPEIVSAGLAAVAWAAQKAGMTPEEAQELFNSVRIEDGDDEGR